MGVSYSQLLFFRSELKVADADEFMTRECRVMKKFLFLKGQSVKEIYDMSVTWGEKKPFLLDS